MCDHHMTKMLCAVWSVYRPLLYTWGKKERKTGRKKERKKARNIE